MSVVPYKSVNTKSLLFGQLERRKGKWFCPVFYKSPESHLLTKSPPLTTTTGLLKKGKRYSIDVDLEESRQKSHRDFYNLITSIDDMCIDCVYERSTEWFKKKIPKRSIQSRYNSPALPGWDSEPAKIRMEVLVEGPQDVVDKKYRPLTEELVVPGSKVIAIMQLLGFWVDSDFLGAHWRITKLVANVENPAAEEAERKEREEAERKEKELEMERQKEKEQREEKEAREERAREKDRRTEHKNREKRRERGVDDEKRVDRRDRDRRDRDEVDRRDRDRRERDRNERDRDNQEERRPRKERREKSKSRKPEPKKEKEQLKDKEVDSFEDNDEIITDDEVYEEQKPSTRENKRESDKYKREYSEDEHDKKSYDSYDSDESYYSN